MTHQSQTMNPITKKQIKKSRIGIAGTVGTGAGKNATARRGADAGARRRAAEAVGRAERSRASSFKSDFRASFWAIPAAIPANNIPSM